MDNRVRVIDVNIDLASAKEAMKVSLEYLDTEPMNVVELVTAETLLLAKQNGELKAAVEQSDLILAGQKEILEAAGVGDARLLREAGACAYLKMYLKYLHRIRARLYLLAGTEEELLLQREYLSSRYRGIQLAGGSAGSEYGGSAADDMLVNAINGSESDCVLATLPAPGRELFAVRNRERINARMWLGTDDVMKTSRADRQTERGLLSYLDRLFFIREARKSRRAEKE